MAAENPTCVGEQVKTETSAPGKNHIRYERSPRSSCSWENPWVNQTGKNRRENRLSPTKPLKFGKTLSIAPALASDQD